MEVSKRLWRAKFSSHKPLVSMVIGDDISIVSANNYYFFHQGK